MVALTAATREHPQVLVGASPRGSLALLLLSRAVAAMSGRDFVVPEDVKDVAVAALAHRITLRPEMWLRRVDAGAIVVAALLDQVPAPATGGDAGVRRPSASPAPAGLTVTQPESGESTPTRPASSLWTPTRALGRAVLLAGGLMLVGALLGRLDLVALAAPFARRRGLGAAPATGRASPGRAGAAGRAAGRGQRGHARWYGSANADARAVRPAWSPASRRRAGCRWTRPTVLMRQTCRPDQVAEVELHRPGAALGPARDRPRARLRGGRRRAAHQPRRSMTPAGQLRVYPIPPAFRADRAMPRAAALVGLAPVAATGRGRRAGRGAPLRAGDRLRRIDWRVTLRTGEPHVAATWSDRDAKVVLVLDVRRRPASRAASGQRVGAGHDRAGGRRHRRALPAPRRPGGPGRALRRLRGTCGPRNGRRHLQAAGLVLAGLRQVTRAEAGRRRRARRDSSSTRRCSRPRRWSSCSPRCSARPAGR